MSNAAPLLVFSDLDGTLIDHETYSWDPAKPALEALRAAGAGLVLASSKTAVEMAGLRRDIGFEDWPGIVENGAGLLPARAGRVTTDATYNRLRAALDGIPTDLRRHFKGFGDLSVAEVAAVTGLELEKARAAKARAFSEPGTWTGPDPALADFLAALKPEGITAQQGGRFLSLSFGGNKADRVQNLLRDIRPAQSLALGDAPNDIQMLESTDFGVIVFNPDGSGIPHLPAEAEGRVWRTQKPGPAGWNEAVLGLLERLGLRRTLQDG